MDSFRNAGLLRSARRWMVLGLILVLMVGLGSGVAATQKAPRADASLRTDKGCLEQGQKAVYAVGEHMQISFRVDGVEKAFVRLTNSLPNGQTQVLLSRTVSGGQALSLRGTTEQPTGERTLGLTVWQNEDDARQREDPIAQARCSFLVESAGVKGDCGAWEGPEGTPVLQGDVKVTEVAYWLSEDPVGGEIIGYYDCGETITLGPPPEGVQGFTASVTLNSVMICEPEGCEPTYTWPHVTAPYTTGGPNYNILDDHTVTFSYDPLTQGTYIVRFNATCGEEECPPCEMFVEFEGEGCVEPPDDLVAWWPFDETSGNIAHDIKGSHDGTYHSSGSSTIISNTGEYVDNSLEFNGWENAEAYVEVPDHDDLDVGTGDFSVDAWVKFAEPDPETPQTSEVFLLRKGSPSVGGIGVGYTISVAQDYISYCQHHNGTATFGASGSMNMNDYEWHMIAVTVDRDENVSFYFDGMKIGDQYLQVLYPGVPNLNNPDPVYLGGTWIGSGCSLLGIGKAYIDELEFYKRSLTAQEIGAIYNADTEGKCKPPIEQCE